MKLILKNNYIYIPAGTSIYDWHVPVEVEILDTMYTPDYNYVVIINGEQTVFNGSFTINKKHLNSKTLDISIVATRKDNGEQTVYTADSCAVTKAFLLGKPMDECYPSIISSLTERINYLEEKLSIAMALIEANSDVITEHSGDIRLCQKAIVQLNEEGELL